MSTRLKAVDALNQFHFESHSSSRPYFMQGSTAFDSSPLKKQRHFISRSAKVKSAAMQFWSTAGLSAEQAMPKETYVFVHRRISKALAPELTEAEAAEAMVVGTIVGALGGGSAVALHGPLFAAVGAACSVM